MKNYAVPFPYFASLLIAAYLLLAAYHEQAQDIEMLKAKASLVPVHRQWVKKLAHQQRNIASRKSNSEKVSILAANFH